MLRELGQTRVGWAGGSQFVFSQHCKSLRALGVAEEKIAVDPRTGRRPTVTTGPSGSCWPTPTASPTTTAGCPTGCSTPCRGQLGDEEILELTYITTLYLQHAVMSRALRTEFDDRDDPVVEVPGPPGEPSAMHSGTTDATDETKPKTAP